MILGIRVLVDLRDENTGPPTRHEATCADARLRRAPAPVSASTICSL